MEPTAAGLTLGAPTVGQAEGWGMWAGLILAFAWSAYQQFMIYRARQEAAQASKQADRATTTAGEAKDTANEAADVATGTAAVAADMGMKDKARNFISALAAVAGKNYLGNQGMTNGEKFAAVRADVIGLLPAEYQGIAVDVDEAIEMGLELRMKPQVKAGLTSDTSKVIAAAGKTDRKTDREDKIPF